MKYQLEILNNTIQGDSLDGLISQIERVAEIKDYSNLIEEIKLSIQATDPDMPIIFEENERQNVLAHLEYGRHHKTPYHKIVYKRSFVYWQHALVHELMHLEMYINATHASKGHLFKKKDENEKYFTQSFGMAFKKLIPKYGPEAVFNLKKMIQDGLITQLLSCPLDLFVEQHIKERYSDLAVLQLLSLLHQERTNISQHHDTFTTMMPPKVVSVNKTLCLVNSLRLREYYGLDFLELYKARKQEEQMAEDLFEEYIAYKDTYNDGDEYEMYDYFAESLNIEKIVNKIME